MKIFSGKEKAKRFFFVFFSINFTKEFLFLLKEKKFVFSLKIFRKSFSIVKMVRVIGLMSGSSLDGLDIACVDFDSDDESKFDLVFCQTIEYSSYWRETLSNCSQLDARSFLLLHHRYGEFLGRQNFKNN